MAEALLAELEKRARAMLPGAHDVQVSAMLPDGYGVYVRVAAKTCWFPFDGVLDLPLAVRLCATRLGIGVKA